MDAAPTLLISFDVSLAAVHGLGGTPEDLTYLKEELEGDSRTLVHLARCNAKNTRDGIAAGGSRLAEEVGGCPPPLSLKFTPMGNPPLAEHVNRAQR